MRDITNFPGSRAQFSQKLSYPPFTPSIYRLIPRIIRSFIHTTGEATSQTGRMGIKQLFSIIKEEAPEAVKEGEIKNHFGRKVAIVSLQWLLCIILHG